MSRLGVTRSQPSWHTSTSFHNSAQDSMSILHRRQAPRLSDLPQSICQHRASILCSATTITRSLPTGGRRQPLLFQELGKRQLTPPSKQGMPFMNITQACTVDVREDSVKVRIPNGNELRYLYYTSSGLRGQGNLPISFTMQRRVITAGGMALAKRDDDDRSTTRRRQSIPNLWRLPNSFSR